MYCFDSDSARGRVDSAHTDSHRTYGNVSLSFNEANNEARPKMTGHNCRVLNK